MAAGVLVIGYGNTLRGDDGIGPAVAEVIARLAFPGVRVIVAPSLTPELIADIAEARRVVFVDAAAAGEAVTVTHLAAGGSAPTFTHAPDPRALLAAARAVFGHSPEAWLVTAAGADFGYRDGLTELGRERARLCVAQVERLLQP